MSRAISNDIIIVTVEFECKAQCNILSKTVELHLEIDLTGWEVFHSDEITD